MSSFDMDDDDLVSGLENENRAQRQEIAQLRDKLADLDPGPLSPEDDQRLAQEIASAPDERSVERILARESMLTER